MHEGAPGYENWYTVDVSILEVGEDGYDYDTNPCGYNLGCTDPLANNTLDTINSYTYDDGSCTYDVYGCMEESAENYNVPSNSSYAGMEVNIEDGSCKFLGCTQPLAVNQTK